MRINSINFNVNNQYAKQNFKGIAPMTHEAAKELFGDKEQFYGFLSEINRTDIWTFKQAKGGMAKADAGYVVLIQDKDNGGLIKALKCDEQKSNIDTLLEKIKRVLVWIKAPDNFAISNVIRGSQVCKDSAFVDDIVNEMVAAATSREADSWANVVDKI